MTFDLLFEDNGKETLRGSEKVTTTEELAEWNYGQYEGLLTGEIRALRREHGLDTERPWDIWRDGCEDGESVYVLDSRDNIDITTGPHNSLVVLGS